MSAVVIDGKAAAEEVFAMLEWITDSMRRNNIIPKLHILPNGDPASDVYVRQKVKACERLGIECEVTNSKWTMRTAYNPVIAQLPRLDNFARPLADSSPYMYDVDGIGRMNIAALYRGQNGVEPCTPSGIMHLLRKYNVPLEGKHMVIVGRSEIVGKPLALMALNADMTVTVCHSHTENLAEITRTADVLVSATGIPKLIKSDMVKPGAAVIDVGITRVNGRLCGDVDFETVKEIAGYITPVPGGVGPMTVAMLMRNVVNAYK